MKKSLVPVLAQSLEVGMFLDTIGGSWIDSPFWRKSFLIEDMPTLARLRKLGAVECWIDPARGTAPDAPLQPQQAGAAPPAAAPALGNDAALRRAAQMRQHAGDATAAIFHELRLGRAIDSAECQALVEQISDAALMDSDAAMALLRLKQKDEYTHMHSVATCVLMVNLARELGMTPAERQQAGLAGLLHDVGKVRIPLEILNKAGSLTDEEYAIVRAHPADSYELLAQAGVPETVRAGCLHHHEKFDGSGYPKRLAGALIPVLGRMCAICDVYDAITSNRPYKDGWDPGESIARMMSWKGHFDPLMLGKFVRSVGIYPSGTLVRLRSQVLAVVVRQNRSDLTRPVVFTCHGLGPEQVLRRELDLMGGCDAIVGIEDRLDWPELDVDRLWQPYLEQA